MTRNSQTPLPLFVSLIGLIFTSPAWSFTPSGGIDAHPSKFPGYVRIGMPSSTGKSGQCSAVKIAPKIYLTAAHCIQSPIFTKSDHIRVINLGNRTAKVVSKSVAPTVIKSKGRSSGWADQQDLGIFEIDREIPEIQIADISLISGKLALQNGDVFRMVGKRDISKPVYSFVDVKATHYDSFCINTSSRFEDGSIRPGDSGGPLYLIRNGKLYLAGITIEYVEESRVTRNGKGQKVYSTVNVTQRFTRIDLAAPSKAAPWVSQKIGNIQTGNHKQYSGRPSPKRSIFSGKRSRQTVRRRL